MKAATSSATTIFAIPAPLELEPQRVDVAAGGAEEVVLPGRLADGPPGVRFRAGADPARA
jgi:hypothetical protein